MKVLHLSTYDISGGAALAAYRLHQAMLKHKEFSSSMLVLGKRSQDQSVNKIKLATGITARAKRRISGSRLSRDHAPYARAISQVELFSDDRGVWTDGIAENVRGFDIIHLQWVSRFLNYRSFFRSVPEKVPLVWCLEDMNPFTGGCHYDDGCGRFAEACGRCPKLQSQEDHDLSRAIWERKRSALDQLSEDKLHIVTLNHWMADQVRRSSLFRRFDCSIISNAVDLEEFRPVPKPASREALGIPSGRQVLAFVAESASNVRKGFPLLCSALERLKTRSNLLLLVAGDSHHLPQLNVPSIRVGFVQSPIFLRQIYSAADLFVIPSLEDNQPNTVMEAMACGTPVVGFNVGGIPEMFDPSAAGLLVTRGNVQELAQAIESVLDNEQLRESLGRQARKRAEWLFSPNRQVEQYFQLYSRLLERSGGSRSKVAQDAHDKHASLVSCP